MISVAVLLLTVPASALSLQEFEALPSICILAGSKNSGYLPSDMQLIRQVKSYRKFETLQDGTLCSRQSDSQFILVRKTFPEYKRLRFKTHLVELFKSFGTAKPLSFERLVPGEFSDQLNSQLQLIPAVAPQFRTLVRFGVGLSSRLNLPEFPLELTRSQAFKPSVELLELLKANPAVRIDTLKEQQKRASSLAPPDSAMELTLVPVPKHGGGDEQRIEGVRLTSEYLQQRQLDLDVVLDSLLTDPFFDTCRETRKLRTVEQVQASDPKFYSMLTKFLEEDMEYSKVYDRESLKDRFSRATIAYEYSFKVSGWCGKSMFTLELP